MKFQDFLIVLFICGGKLVDGVRIYENTRNDTIITSTTIPNNHTTQSSTTTTTQTPNLSIDPVQYQLSENISKESEQSVSNR